MTVRVLLVQNKPETIRLLMRFFQERGDEIWHAGEIDEAFSLLDLINPDLLVMDLHFPGNEWVQVLSRGRQNNPDLKILITNESPDLERELIARNQGASVFLRQPFSKKWLERSLTQLNMQNRVDDQAAKRQGLRFPFLLRIFLPYLLLALLVLVGGGLLSYRYIQDWHERDVRAGMLQRKDTLEHLLQMEEQLLSLTVCSITAREGFIEAVLLQDQDRLIDLLQTEITPVDYEDIEVLNPRGDAIVSMRNLPWREQDQFEISSGEDFFRSAEFVKHHALNKAADQETFIAAVMDAPWGDIYYIGQALYQDGELQGYLLVGKSLQTAGAHLEDSLNKDITVYDTSGRLIHDTFSFEVSNLTMPYSQVREVMEGGAGKNQAREMFLEDREYLELFLPWRSSSAEDLALLGIVEPYQVENAIQTSYALWILALVILSAGAAFAIAWVISKRVRLTVERHGEAAMQVASGNLELKLKLDQGDELDNLAIQFNSMVTGIQARLLEHDLFGVSDAFEPESTESALPVDLLPLEGRETLVTVLQVQPVGFQKMVKEHGPKVAFESLNEMLQALASVAADYDGIVTHFDEEALLFYFGLFPHTLLPAESAYHACSAAKSMRAAVRNLNLQRAERDLPQIHFTAVIDSGRLAAGALYLKGRLHYAVTGAAIGFLKAMRAFQHAEELNMILLSAAVAESLAEHQDEFELSSIESEMIKYDAPVSLYRLH